MSYIDTFDHQHVGWFAGLPIYYAPTQVKRDGPDEFSCGPENLVLGGGGGEHPALVFHRLDCLALRYVLHAIPDDDRSVREQFGDFPIMEYLEVPYADQFEYAEWSVKHYYFFYEMCTSPAMCCPHGTFDYYSFEDWLAASFGELVWFSFPELIKNLDPVRRMYPDLRPLLNNVTIPPPGYPARYGRKIVDGELVWGDPYFKNSTRPSNSEE